MPTPAPVGVSILRICSCPGGTASVPHETSVDVNKYIFRQRYYKKYGLKLNNIHYICEGKYCSSGRYKSQKGGFYSKGKKYKRFPLTVSKWCTNTTQPRYCGFY